MKGLCDIQEGMELILHCAALVPLETLTKYIPDISVTYTKQTFSLLLRTNAPLECKISNLNPFVLFFSEALIFLTYFDCKTKAKTLTHRYFLKSD